MPRNNRRKDIIMASAKEGSLNPSITVSNASLSADQLQSDLGISGTNVNLDVELEHIHHGPGTFVDDSDEEVSSSLLDTNIQALKESLQELDEYENLIANKAQSKAEENVEKRKVRYKRNKINEQLKQLCFKREMQKTTTTIATPRKKTKPISDTKFKIPETMIAKLPLDESKENDYYRLLKVANSYREKITSLYNELDDKLDEVEDSLSEYDKEEKKMEINTKIETMKALLQEYQKRNNEMALMANITEVPKHVNNLENILDMSNKIQARIKASDERSKQKMALSKSEQLEGMKLTKFNGIGDQKFLNYYSFFQEFNELVMAKPYSDSTKLRYLKQYLEGDALQIVKNYHSGTELRIAMNALDEVYGRSDMVIRETLKSIQKLNAMTSEHNLKANKAFLYKITTILSTLRCYNFEIDSDQSENSTIMISIEEKLPQETFLKWEDWKMEARKARRNVNIEEFVKFFSEKVKKEENVSFIKGSNKQELEKTKAKTKMYQTNFKETGRKPNESNNYSRNRDSNYSNANFYCIFCEKKGSHSSGWCKVSKHSMKFKEQKCLKHNACFSCLRTTDHKSESCPYRQECRICKKFHHFNLHSRSDIISFYQKKKNDNNRQ